MSVSKLLARIVGPREDATSPDGKDAHDFTFGITSDPLTQFACVFSALIHDAGRFCLFLLVFVCRPYPSRLLTVPRVSYFSQTIPGFPTHNW